jgi:hypothetical protein
VSYARHLLARAAARYDADPTLAIEARQAMGDVFGRGLGWMARRSATDAAGSGRRLGLRKYGACVLGASAVAGVVVLTAGPSVGSALGAIAAWLVVFYGIESRLVFVFPAAAHGEKDPFATSTRLVREYGGTLAAMGVVVPLALTMLFGGFLGRGFLRSWCLGCLAVLDWYTALARRR